MDNDEGVGLTFAEAKPAIDRVRKTDKIRCAASMAGALSEVWFLEPEMIHPRRLDNNPFANDVEKS